MYYDMYYNDLYDESTNTDYYVNESMSAKERNALPDEVFGIPEKRKYPMPDKKHTLAAIRLFNHVEPKYEEELAYRIIANMKKYDIDPSVVGKNNRLRKYIDIVYGQK